MIYRLRWMWAVVVAALLIVIGSAALAADSDPAPSIWRYIDWQDLFALLAGVIGWALMMLERKAGLPAIARKWLKKVTEERVKAIIKTADELTDMTPAQRREWAISELQDQTFRLIGLTIPRSAAGLLVDYVYRKWVELRMRKGEPRDEPTV